MPNHTPDNLKPHFVMRTDAFHHSMQKAGFYTQPITRDQLNEIAHPLVKKFIEDILNGTVSLGKVMIDLYPIALHQALRDASPQTADAIKDKLNQYALRFHHFLKSHGLMLVDIDDATFIERIEKNTRSEAEQIANGSIALDLILHFMPENLFSHARGFVWNERYKREFFGPPVVRSFLQDTDTDYQTFLERFVEYMSPFPVDVVWTDDVSKRVITININEEKFVIEDVAPTDSIGEAMFTPYQQMMDFLKTTGWQLMTIDTGDTFMRQFLLPQTVYDAFVAFLDINPAHAKRFYNVM